MGFYIRKSFRAGPIRFNLSKSGIGASIGVTGARVGITSQGRSYVHAGRGGLYFRQYGKARSKARSRQAAQSSNFGCLGVLLLLFGLWLVVKTFQVITENPALLATLLALLVAAGGYYLYRQFSNKAKKARVDAYATSLKECLAHMSDTSALQDCLRSTQEKLRLPPEDDMLKGADEELYSHALGQILDDAVIEQHEYAALQTLEAMLHVSQTYTQKQKKEFFDMYCLQAVADHEVSESEAAIILHLAEKLGLHPADMADSLATVEEFLAAQKHPLEPLDKDSLSVTVQQSEQVFYAGRGRVLSPRKGKSSNKEKDLKLLREGELLLTQKRLLVVNQGATSIRYSQVLDAELDLENRRIVISKDGRQTPFFVETFEAVLVFKLLQRLAQDTA